MPLNQKDENDKNNKDPWSGENNKNKNPPDIDKLIRNFILKINTLVSKKKQLLTPEIKQNSKNIFLKFLSFLVVFLLAIWMLSGLYFVDSTENAAVTRFGKYVYTEGPGLHWITRFAESKYIVNTQEIYSYQYSSDLLTKDENIINISAVVQYRIFDVYRYLFNFGSFQDTLQHAFSSALCQVIGNSYVDDVLIKHKTDVKKQIETTLSAILKSYNSGIEITDITLQSVKLPDEVSDAFEKSNKAKETAQNTINEAKIYKENSLNKTKSFTKILLQEAQAYQWQVVLNAKGETARFLAFLSSYQKAPNVTKDRMYFDTIEYILSKSNKIIIDSSVGNNSINLPLDQWFKEEDQKEKPVNTAASEKITQTIKQEEMSESPRIYRSKAISQGRETSL